MEFGHRLDWMISEVFSNLIHSMTVIWGNHNHPHKTDKATQHVKDGHPTVSACAISRAGGGRTRSSPLACALRAGPAQWQRSLLGGGGKKALPRPCPFLSPSLCPRARTSRAAVPLLRRRPSKRVVPPPLRGNGGVRPIRGSPPPPAGLGRDHSGRGGRRGRMAAMCSPGLRLGRDWRRDGTV